MKIFYLFLPILFLSFNIIADEKKEFQKSILRWKKVDNAISYKIEIKSDSGFSKSFEQKNTEVQLELKPSDYKYRVGAVNKFGKVKQWSKWENLEVILSTEPIVDKNLKYSFIISDIEKEIIVKGQYFLDEIEISLIGKNGKIDFKNYQRISKNEIRFTISLKDSGADSLKLTLKNPLNKFTVIDNFIELKEKPIEVIATKEIEERNQVSKKENIENLEPKKEFKTYPLMPPLWRSMIFPGWGQAYKNENTKSYIFSGSTIFLLGALYYFDKEKKSAISRSEKLTTNLFLIPGDASALPYALFARSESLSYSDKAEGFQRKQELGLGILLGLYTYNIYDIIINRNSKTEIQSSSFFINGNFGVAGKESFVIGYTYSF